MATGSTINEYVTLMNELGYQTAGANTGFVRGDTLRQASSAGDGFDDRRFRYAAILDSDKLGVTDVFEINGTPCIYMKSLASDPSLNDIHHWHRTAWNHGLGRMLWIITPTRVRILNAFQPPPKSNDEQKHPAELLSCAIQDLEQLRKYELDRISLESGQFWATRAGKRISKETRIDAELANDLRTAAEMLTDGGCKPLLAHRLMLRTLFTAYLEARGVLPTELFEGLHAKSFGDVLSRVGETKKFFERMRETFNGDLFPPPPTPSEDDVSYTFSKAQLEVAQAIVKRQNLRSGQQSFDFWRYDFEVIPIELISSIYERFIYADDQATAKARGTHYTPVNLVDLVFSQVFDDQLFSKELPRNAKVCDLACGSGVFLVDAFRRLVARRIAGGEKLTRTLVRSVLSEQLYGVDVNETAIEIAAFSLCLTAFELDPSLNSAQHLKFRHSLKNRNLFVADAFSSDSFSNTEAFKQKEFSIVVGNPPWNKPKGERSTSHVSSRSHLEYCEQQDPPIELPFRSPIDQAFIWRSRDFLKPNGRIGLIIDAKNFFSQEGQSLKSKSQLFTTLRARAMLNLSTLHNKKLFPSAEQPAMIFVAENAAPKSGDQLVFASAERSETFGKHGIVELFLERLNHLPNDRIAVEPHLFKIASYGTPRDRTILKELQSKQNTLEEVLRNWNVAIHQGFITGDFSRPVPKGFPSKKVENCQLPRFRMSADDLPCFDYEKLQWPRSKEIYSGPILLVQQSLQEDKLAASICVTSVCYSSSYFGIPFNSEDQIKFSAMCAFLSSSLATYFFFLTATRFGIDKQIAMPNDIVRLPFNGNANSQALQRLAASGSSQSLSDVDEEAFNCHEIPKWQREYITDTVKYDLNFVRHGSDGTSAQSPDEAELANYADTLVKCIRSNLTGGELTVNADILADTQDICCVVIRFDEARNRGVRFADKSQAEFDSRRLAELLHAPLTSNFQLRRSMIHYDNDRCIIVKLAQKRFWSRARAYDDADSIFDELCREGE